MSSEHIVNQHQIQNQRKEQMDEAAALKHISKDLKQTNNETIVKPIANDTLDATNIQKLLSHQSDQTKQAILKKSYDYILQNNPINEGLQEELNKEIDHYFKTPSSSDQTSVSDEYKEATSRKTDDPARRQALTKGASNTIQSKNNQKRNNQVQANPNRHTEEETDDPLLNHKKLYETTTKKTQQQLRQETAHRQPNQSLQQQDVKEFAKLVSKYALNQNPKTKQQMDQLQQQLLKKGVSQSEIVHMSAKVGQLVKQHMMYDLKQKLINYHMTKGFTTQDKASAKFEFNTLANQLHDLQAKGALNKSIHNAVEHLQHQAKQDLGNFLYEESINQFTKHSLGQISIDEFTEQLLKLQKAANSAGVHFSEQELSNRITAAIDHLGLSEFTAPDPDSENPEKT